MYKSLKNYKSTNAFFMTVTAYTGRIMLNIKSKSSKNVQLGIGSRTYRLNSP